MSDKHILLVMLGILVLLPCVACERRDKTIQGSNGPAEAHNWTVVYNVILCQQAEGDAAIKVAEGRIWLDAPIGGEGEFEGRWELLALANAAPALARLQGGGVFKGITAETGTSVDLHPGTVDHNLVLLLHREEGDVSRGTWHVATDAGVEAAGPLELVALPEGTP